MKYTDPTGKQFLIYLKSEYRNIWRIENLPFDNVVRDMSESQKNQFIKMNKLKPEEKDPK